MQFKRISVAHKFSVLSGNPHKIHSKRMGELPEFHFQCMFDFIQAGILAAIMRFMLELCTVRIFYLKNFFVNKAFHVQIYFTCMQKHALFKYSFLYKPQMTIHTGTKL